MPNLALRLFLDLLRHRVVTLVVRANLAQHLMISPPTARAWLEAIELVYFCFAVTPYTAASARARARAAPQAAKDYANRGKTCEAV